MEASGFAVKRLSSSVKFAPGNIEVGSLSLNTDSSVLNFSKIALKADSSGSFKISQLESNLM